MTKHASLGFVFMVVFLDMLGFGLIMPVLPSLIMELGAFPVDRAAIWAGWLGAGYAALQFIFAPIIGNLSDRFGRRPVLLASIFAFGLDYLLMAFAPTLWWLVVGRMIAGITGASFSAAYAYIADITPPEKRAANFGLVGMAFGLGFIFGPALGGALGVFDPRYPFLAAAALAFLNFAIGFFVLRESLPPEKRRAFNLARANAFSSLKALGQQNTTVLWFVAALGVWQLAHLVYPIIWAYFAIAAFGWGEAEIGFSLACVGISSALVQGLGLRYLAPKLGERNSVIVGIASVLIVSLVYAFVRFDPLIYAALLFGGLQGLVQPSIAAMNSRFVDATSQGELQGATQAVGSLAAVIGPPIYTLVFAAFAGAEYRFPGMPILLAAGFALIALALFLMGLGRAEKAADIAPSGG
ncbi:TCR/Tet family MFS transporter [Pontixanthobacter aquaemixtae]|uniref:MFS transporter n=1 Tax=Pontixanthobacter aquaemixtae TaxID=1958940 RepID=A0A844ZWU1_9SPHN|nr:TCR/Tet family MFS transporter [Pontixanthobacter aquaemixtae]MXO91650.1 MFS transporter [Pontixanthobacter aquaemixtae]